jgi:crossover junction endodeoxyribonuclease RuvC
LAKERVIRVLGIDPGFAITGYALLEQRGSVTVCPEAGTIETRAGTAFGRRLLQLRLELKTVLDRLKPDEAAVEELFFTKNVKTAIKVAEARGVILATLFEEGFEVFEYTPTEVKRAVTGSGSADKGQVLKMMKMVLTPVRMPAKDDAVDAMAIAFCHCGNLKRISSKVERRTSNA